MQAEYAFVSYIPGFETGQTAGAVLCSYRNFLVSRNMINNSCLPNMFWVQPNHLHQALDKMQL